MDSLNSWLTNLSGGWVLFAACAALAVLFALVGMKASAGELKLKPDAGYDKPMLAFELNAGAATQMFESWDAETKSVLRTALMWDFLFIFIYPGLIAAVCLVGARYLDARGYLGLRVSIFFILLALFAAALDAVENCALLGVLGGQEANLLPAVARWCAIVKFACAFTAGGYALLACFAAAALWLYHLVAGRPPIPS